MLFNSGIFLFVFLPVVLGTMAAIRRWKPGWEKYVLIFVSLAFYGYWSRRFLVMLLLAVFLNWLLASLVIRYRQNRFFLSMGVVGNLLLLGFFKYMNFFSDALSAIDLVHAGHWNIILPLAISFFTFHQISYLIDVYRGDNHLYSFPDYLLYIVFFPHLIAGPIVRHNEFIYQIEETRGKSPSMAYVAEGLTLFLIGLSKKMLLADPLAGISDAVFQTALTQSLGTVDSIVATLAFALQIYFDFSGYTDMAIGLSLLLGYRLPVNFNAPYAASSLIDFWRRWHMTLSRFLRDYLYIPMGGSRHGKPRQMFALLITMLFGGLWHGANWTFIVWGGAHGLGLVINHVFRGRGVHLPAPLAWFVTFAFTALCFVLFRAESLSHAGNVLAGFHSPAISEEAMPSAYVSLMLAMAMAIAVLGPTSQAATQIFLRHRIAAVALGAAAAVSIFAIFGFEGDTPFIYFQF